MPVHIEHRGGDRPWKIVERDGHVVGSSTNEDDARASARARNQAHREKQQGKR